MRQNREACGEAHHKVILGTRELATMGNVARASMVAMMAGAVGDEIERVARILVANGTVRIDVAEIELKALRDGRGA